MCPLDAVPPTVSLMVFPKPILTPMGYTRGNRGTEVGHLPKTMQVGGDQVARLPGYVQRVGLCCFGHKTWRQQDGQIPPHGRRTCPRWPRRGLSLGSNVLRAEAAELSVPCWEHWGR